MGKGVELGDIATVFNYSMKEVKSIKVKPITAKQSIQEGISSFCKISRTAHISLVFLHNTSHSY